MSKKRGSEEVLRRQVEILKAQIRKDSQPPTRLQDVRVAPNQQATKGSELTLDVPHIKKELMKTLVFFVVTVVGLVLATLL